MDNRIPTLWQKQGHLKGVCQNLVPIFQREYLFQNKKKSKYNNSFTSLKRYGNLSNNQRNICLCLEKKNHIILEIKTKLKPHLISGNIVVRFYKQLQKLSPLFMFESL